MGTRAAALGVTTTLPSDTTTTDNDNHNNNDNTTTTTATTTKDKAGVDVECVHDASASAVAQSCETCCSANVGIMAVAEIVGGVLDDKLAFLGASAVQSEIDKAIKDWQITELMPTIPRTTRSSPKLPGWGHIIEFCTHPDSSLGRIAAQDYPHVKVHRACKNHDFGLRRVVDDLKNVVRQALGVSLHASLPCTVWCQ